VRLPEIVFLAAIGALAAGLCLYGWFIAGYAATVIVPPLAIALALLVFSAVRVLRSRQPAATAAEAELQRQYWEELRGSYGGALWCLLVLPLLLLLGMPLGLAVFAAAYARAHGGSWRGSIACGAAVLFAVWLFAMTILGLPVGWLPGWWA
jgi:hypothetical protein